jgi:YVTN family beta-propeller protein
MKAFYLLMLLASSVFAQSSEQASRVFVVNKAGNNVSVVNAKSFAVEHTIAVGRGPHELAVTPNGLKAYVPNTGDNTVSVVDLKTHAEVKKISSPDFGYPHGVAFTGDSRRALITSERASKIVVIDVETDTVVRSISMDQEGAHMVVINKAGTWAYSANRQSNTVSFVDLKELKIAANVRVGRGGEGIALSPNEKEVWVSNVSEGTLSVVDIAKRETVATIPAGQSPFRVVFTPDGKHALSASSGSGVNVYDTAARKQVANVPVRGATGVIVAADGKLAFVSCGNTSELQIVDTATWAVTGSVAVGRSPDGLAYR